MAKKLEQPQIDIQQLYDAVLEEKDSIVTFRGKKRTIGWLKNGTVRKFSSVMVQNDESDKRNAKLCAIVLLNNYWKIKFFYWIYWRWLYYICDLDDVEVLAILLESKKKIQSSPYSLTTILAIEMMDTMMTMRKKEAPKVTPLALHGEQDTL